MCMGWGERVYVKGYVCVCEVGCVYVKGDVRCVCEVGCVHACM